MLHNKKLILIAFVFVMLSSVLSGEDLRNITLQLKWKHQFQFAGYYAAIEKRYYKEAGFEVKIKELSNDESPFTSVLTGKADFGTSTTDILLARSQGQKVVVLATIFQHSPHIFLTLKASNINYIHNLTGKKIAIEPGADELIAFLKAEGINLNRITIEDYDFDINKLIDGRLDAISAYSTDELFFFQQKGVQVSELMPTSAGIDFYGDLLFTSEDMIRSHPRTVEKFRAASLKGWTYAMKHQEEIIQLIYNKYSKRHSIEHIRYEAERMQQLVLPNVVEIGYTNPGRWEAIIDTYKRLGRIKQEENIKGLLYSDYIVQKLKIPWKIIIVLSIILLVTVIFLHFYYKTSQNLQKEVNSRAAIQKELEDREIEIKSKNEALEKLNTEKDKFFSIIAHDLRSPFHTFLGMTQLLLEQIDKLEQDKIQHFAVILNKSATNLFRLLENLLEWSRIESGLTVPQPMEFSLNDALSESLKMFKDTAILKKIEINTDISSDHVVVADRKMIETVFRNLMSNAIKFTPKGGRIIVTTKLVAEEFVSVMIKDTGIGISEEMLNSLFTISAKVGRLGTEGESSSGLGLLLSKEMVELNGGKLEVQSQEGIGSEFKFTLKSLNN